MILKYGFLNFVIPSTESQKSSIFFFSFFWKKKIWEEIFFSFLEVPWVHNYLKPDNSKSQSKTGSPKACSLLSKSNQFHLRSTWQKASLFSSLSSIQHSSIAYLPFSIFFYNRFTWLLLFLFLLSSWLLLLLSFTLKKWKVKINSRDYCRNSTKI